MAETTETTPKKKGATKPKPSRIDWERIERDYRTGQLTLRELSIKHGAAFGHIGQRAKKYGWTQDLREIVRQATSAKLIASLTVQQTHNNAQSTAQIVEAVAEANARVSLAGPLHHCFSGTAARRAAICSRPSNGWMARMSTAAG